MILKLGNFILGVLLLTPGKANIKKQYLDLDFSTSFQCQYPTSFKWHFNMKLPTGKPIHPGIIISQCISHINTFVMKYELFHKGGVLIYMNWMFKMLLFYMLLTNLSIIWGAISHKRQHLIYNVEANMQVLLPFEEPHCEEVN